MYTDRIPSTSSRLAGYLPVYYQQLTLIHLSSLILLGILISYLPQHFRIINRRSSFGLSPYFVLLGTTSGTCQFANILTLPGSRADMACCRDVSGFACFAGLLGVMQVGMQWICFAVMYEMRLLHSESQLIDGIQTLPLPNLLPARHARHTKSRKGHRQDAIIPHRANRRLDLRRARPRHSNNIHILRLRATRSPSSMGEFPRYTFHCSGCDTVFSADLYDVGYQEGG